MAAIAAWLHDRDGTSIGIAFEARTRDRECRVAKRSTALLGEFFADHPGPATREACIAALVQRYRISEPRAHEWLEHALEAGTLQATDDGVSPRDLAPVEAVAHVLASHPAGLPWAKIAERIVAEGLCPTPLKRGPGKDERIVRAAGGVFRHRLFAAEPPPPVPSTPPRPEPEPGPATAARAGATRPRRSGAPKRRAAPTEAPTAPAPVEDVPRARELPIVRRRRDAPTVAVPGEPDSVRLLRAIAAALCGSARAIELQALREHVEANTSIGITGDKLRSLLVTHAAEHGWHVRGPFVSRRHIPWADLDEALASAARGHRRDPAELVARVRRLLRITNTTARSMKEQLQRVGNA